MCNLMQRSNTEIAYSVDIYMQSRKFGICASSKVGWSPKEQVICSARAVHKINARHDKYFRNLPVSTELIRKLGEGWSVLIYVRAELE